MVRKILCLFICLTLLYALIPESLATELTFNECKCNHLFARYKPLYKLATEGIHNIPRGSSKEAILKEMGEPDYVATHSKYEFIYYIEKDNFSIVTFQLKNNILTSTLLFYPTCQMLKSLKPSDIKTIFGKADKNGFKKVTYIDQGQKITFIYTGCLFRTLSTIVVGDISQKELRSWSKTTLFKVLKIYVKNRWTAELEKLEETAKSRHESQLAKAKARANS